MPPEPDRELSTAADPPRLRLPREPDRWARWHPDIPAEAQAPPK